MENARHRLLVAHDENMADLLKAEHRLLEGTEFCEALSSVRLVGNVRPFYHGTLLSTLKLLTQPRTARFRAT